MAVVQDMAGGRRDKRVLKRITAIVPIVALVAIMAQPAAAALEETPDRTWGVNGRVYAILRLGDRIYLGGNFTQAVPPRDSGAPRVDRFSLAAIDAATGELDFAWDPVANGPVYTLAASADGSRVFAGGNFTAVDGTLHRNLVALDPVSGEVDQTWNVNTNYPVWTAVAHGSRLYVGGNFTSITGAGSSVLRYRLAAVDQVSGAVDPLWNPSAGNTVKTLEVSADGTLIYVGGNFMQIAGQRRLWLAAVDTVTGTLSNTWVPSEGSGIIYDFSPCGNGCVLDLEATSTHVYVAVGGKYGNKVMALDAATAALKWQRHADGDVQAVGVRGKDLYVGGHWIKIAQQSGYPRFITFNATWGSIRDFSPYVDSPMGVWSLLTEEARVYLGGDFTKVGPEGAAVDQPGFAQFTDIPVAQ